MSDCNSVVLASSIRVSSVKSSSIFAKGRRRTVLSLILAILGFSLFTSCTNTVQKEKKLAVTIQPLAYFLHQVVGEGYEIHCVVPRGSSPETYDPTPSEMKALAESRAYFMVGSLGFELAWKEKIAQNNSRLKMIDLSEGVELIHGGHNCAEHATDKPHDHSSIGVDPHYWSSPKECLVLVDNLVAQLSLLYPEEKSKFEANGATLKAEIQQTDRMIRQKLSGASTHSFMIYHPSLAYFARDYGLKQLSIEMGGKEPTPAQLKGMVEQAHREGVRVIFVQQEFNQRNAELIAESTECRLIPINPLSYYWSESLISIANALNQ